MIGRAMFAFVIPLDGTPVDPGYGRPGFGGRPDQGLPGYGHPDQGLPGYGHPDQGLPWGPGRPDQGLPGYGHPGNALPIAPVRPDAPVILPPGTWPPQLPPGVDNTLPPGQGHPSQPIVIPPDPSVGIDQPIYLPQLPAGTALLISLNAANVPTPQGAEGHQPAILWQGAGTRPVLVYVSGAPQPK